MHATSNRLLFPLLAALTLAACESKNTQPSAAAVSAAPEAPPADAPETGEAESERA